MILLYDVERHFDREALAYDFLIHRLPGYKSTIKEIIKQIPYGEGKTGLDIRTGTCILAFAMSRMGYEHVQALDLSEKMLRKCSKKGKEMGISNVGCVKSDMLDLPYGDETFDTVVCGYVLHHLPPESKTTEIEEIRRVLKPGDHLIIGDYMEEDENSESRFTTINRILRPIILFFEWGDIFKKEYPITAKEYNDILSDYGFQDIGIAEIEGVPDAVIKGVKE